MPILFSSYENLLKIVFKEIIFSKKATSPSMVTVRADDLTLWEKYQIFFNRCVLVGLSRVAFSPCQATCGWHVSYVLLSLQWNCIFICVKNNNNQVFYYYRPELMKFDQRGTWNVQLFKGSVRYNELNISICLHGSNVSFQCSQWHLIGVINHATCCNLICDICL